MPSFPGLQSFPSNLLEQDSLNLHVADRSSSCGFSQSETGKLLQIKYPYFFAIRDLFSIMFSGLLRVAVSASLAKQYHRILYL